MATNGQSGAWVQAPASLGSPSRLPRVPLLLSTWLWDLTFSLPLLFSSKSHRKGAVCQLCTRQLSLPLSTSASLCPLPAIYLVPGPDLLSLSLHGCSLWPQRDLGSDMGGLLPSVGSAAPQKQASLCARCRGQLLGEGKGKKICFKKHR